METKKYWVIKTVRDTYIRQAFHGENLNLLEYGEDRIIHADFYEDYSLAVTSLSQLINNIAEFMKAVENKEDYPLLKNMGFKIVEAEIEVVKIGN